MSIDTGERRSGQRETLIRLYGDSLSMPRSTEGIHYLETFAERFRAQIEDTTPGCRVSIYNRSRGGVAISTLLEDFRKDSFFFGMPGGSVMILQAGIVDCAPRPLPPLIRRGVAMLPPRAKSRVIEFLHEHRAGILRRGFGWRATSLRTFADVYSEWLSVACRTFELVYAVNIAPTNAATEARSPGFGRSVIQYNSLIKRACQTAESNNVRLIDVHAAILGDERGINKFINANDGHHITAAGHRLYADLLVATLRRDGALGLGPLNEDYR
jgi:hypothetical protein